MEKETFISGYCRTQDCSRMVCAVKENGTLSDVDCAYTRCPFTGECTIAAAIRDFLQD